MNKFASTRINQIKQLQALEDIVVELQRKYASELVAFNKGMNKTAAVKLLASLGLLGLGAGLGYKYKDVIKNKADLMTDKWNTTYEPYLKDKYNDTKDYISNVYDNNVKPTLSDAKTKLLSLFS